MLSCTRLLSTLPNSGAVFRLVFETREVPCACKGWRLLGFAGLSNWSLARSVDTHVGAFFVQGMQFADDTEDFLMKAANELDESYLDLLLSLK